jgi:type VI secretion system protein ImpL
MKEFFKKFFTIFTKAWFWLLVATITLCAIVWFTFPLIKFGGSAPVGSAVVRLVVILLIVIAWSILNLRLHKKTLAAEELAAESVTPEQIVNALTILRNNFNKAWSLVNQGFWGQRLFNSTRYNLPWYLVVGDVGSGRSSLLRHSGLPYPVANESHQQIEHSSDELCQWWFSKFGVFIDTHGKLATELTPDSLEQSVWQELLRLLKSKRSRKPLDGVIFTIDFHQLYTMNDSERANFTHALRLRFHSLNEQLGIQCPIYVCFTKWDRIAGFSEFFAHLTREEQQQIFGFTFRVTNGDSIKEFGAEYDKLLNRLNQQLSLRLHQENDPRHAAAAFNFPLQMARLKEFLNKQLHDLFESSHFQGTHAVRAVCFTSSLQAGTLIDYLAPTARNTFGIDLVEEQEHSGDRPFFIHKLFTQFIFPEQELLLFNATQQQAQRIYLRVAYAVTAITIALFIYIFTYSFWQNHTRLKMMHQEIKSFESVSANLNSDNSSLIYVLPMLDDLRDMRSIFHPEEDPLSLHWGLYQGNNIDAVAEAMYRQNLLIYFVPYMIDVVTTELQNPQAKPSQLYNALRVYLMLGDPTKLKPNFVQNWLAIYWQQKYENRPDVVKSLNSNAAALLQMQLKPITINEALVRDARLKLRDTTQAQRDYFEIQELSEIGSASTLYISTGLNLGFNQTFGSQAARLGVPTLYSKEGYEELFKPQLNNVTENQAYSAWILGDSAARSLTKESDAGEVTQQMRSFYMQDYIAYWNKVLNGLKIVPFNDLQQAGNVLAIAAGPNSPMYEILMTVQENTSLAEEAGKSGGNLLADAQKHLKANQALVKAVQPKAVSGATSKGNQFKPKYGKKGKGAAAKKSTANLTPVDLAFAPLNAMVEDDGTGGAEGAVTPFDKIQEALGTLHEYVMDINTSTNPNEKAYQLVMQRMGGAGGAEAAAPVAGEKAAGGGAGGADPLTLLEEQAKSAPEPLRSWLEAIVQNTWAAMLMNARDYISTQYQKQVLPEYMQSVANRFPFYKDAPQQIGMNEFTQFFSTDGTFDAFFIKYLAPFIDTSRKEWQWKKINGSSLPVSIETLQQIQRAEQIKQVFFAKAGEPSKIAFSLRALTMSAQLKSAVLQLDDKQYNYVHGPKRTMPFEWPGASGRDNYSLVLNDLVDQSFTYRGRGLWGLFQVFSQAYIVGNRGSTDLTLSYSWQGRSVSYLLKVDGEVNPFAPELLSELRLPTKLS